MEWLLAFLRVRSEEMEKIMNRVRYMLTVLVLVWAYHSPTVLWLAVVLLYVRYEVAVSNIQTIEKYIWRSHPEGKE